jgi:hypothetical protein
MGVGTSTAETSEEPYSADYDERCPRFSSRMRAAGYPRCSEILSTLRKMYILIALIKGMRLKVDAGSTLG